METGPRLTTSTAVVPDDALVSQLYMSAVVFFCLAGRARACWEGGHAQPARYRPDNRRGRRLGHLSSTLAPPMLCRRGSAGPPLGGRGCWSRHRLRGPPSKAPSGPCATSSKQAGRLLGRAIPFFFFPRLDEEGSGISRRARLADRVEGWDATAGAADGGRPHR